MKEKVKACSKKGCEVGNETPKKKISSTALKVPGGDEDKATGIGWDALMGNASYCLK